MIEVGSFNALNNPILNYYIYYTEKNDLIRLNSNSGGKWTNQNFLVKSIRILIEITRILIDIIILVKNKNSNKI